MGHCKTKNTWEHKSSGGYSNLGARGKNFQKMDVV